MAEAALQKAQGHLDAEEDDKALQAAAEAIEAFRKAGKPNADAFVVMINAYIAQGRLKDASKLAKDQLPSFSKDELGQAKLQLAYAEANAQGRGRKNRELAMEAAQKAQLLFEKLKDKRMAANAHVLIANTRVSQGNALEAVKAARKAVPLFQEAGDKRGEGIAHHCLGLAFAKGKLSDWTTEDCIGAVKASIACFKAAGLKNMEAFERICLAKWTNEMGEKPAKALQFAQQAQTFCRESCKGQEHVALGVVVECYMAMAKRDSTGVGHASIASQAVKTAKKGVERFEASGNKVGEAHAWHSLAMAQMLRGVEAEAASSAMMAAQAFERVGDCPKEIEMLKLAAGLHLKLRTPAEAAAAASQMMKKATSTPDKVMAMETAFNAHMARKEFALARDVAKKIVSVLHQEGDSKKEANAKIMLALASFKNQDLSAGLSTAKEAQTMMRNVGDLQGEVKCLKTVAKCYFFERQFEMAQRFALQARDLAATAGDQREEGNIALLLANIRMQQLLTLDEKTSAEAFTHHYFDLMDVVRLAMHIGKLHGSKQLVACSLMLMAQAYTTVNEIVEALRLADEAKSIFGQLEDNRNLAHLLIVEADAWNFGGENTKANQSCKQALKIFQELQDAEGENKALDCMERINPPTPPPELVWEEDKPKANLVADKLSLAAPKAAPKEEPTGAKYMKKDLGKVNMKKIDPSLLRDKLYDIVQETIGFEVDFLEDDLPLMQAGVASRQAVTMRALLEDELPGISFPATIVFDMPSINMITDYVLENA